MSSKNKIDSLESPLQTAVGSVVSEKVKSKKKKKGFSREDTLSTSKAQLKKLQQSEWFREKDNWAKYIKQHRKDLRHVKPIVDDRAPKLNVRAIYDAEILKALWKNLKGEFEVNQNILKKLYERSISRGKTDTFTFNYSNAYWSNYEFRKLYAKSIEKENLRILRMIKTTKGRLMTAKEHGIEWKKNEALMESTAQFPLWWKVKKKEAILEIGPPLTIYGQHVTEKSAKYPDKRPRVFFEISMKNIGVVGRMVIMLFSDHVPVTVKNFLAFCDPKAKLTYKGNFFYLIFQNYFCLTGDVLDNKGFRGTSIYGPYFNNEESILTHGERGILTTYQKIPNRNTSQFLITFRKLPPLDGSNVVFGKVIKGMRVLEAIESVGLNKMGRPKVGIYISDCDEI